LVVDRLQNRPWIPALAGAALIVCYAPFLWGMAGQWSSDEDMGHGFVVPLVALWIVWREREHWRALPPRPSAWGFAILAVAACLHAAAALGAGLFAGSLAFLLSLAGAVVCLGGFGYLRSWAFPFLLALFMLPKLAVVYNQVTLPLQLMASRIAVIVLHMAGIAASREGNILVLPHSRVAVAEACNGVRYLLPLGFLALVFAYISDPKPWMRVVLLAAAVPLAILANALRVAATAAHPVLLEGTLHLITGTIVFVLCLALLAVLHRFINLLYARFHA
jgi:exosortase